jgi:hypothetical protein
MPRITRIHVNQHVIRRNAKTGEAAPVLTVKAGGSNTYCHSVQILGPSTVVYSPCKPLSCGARVWIETTAPVVLDGGAAPAGGSTKKRKRGVGPKPTRSNGGNR